MPRFISPAEVFAAPLVSLTLRHFGDTPPPPAIFPR